MNTIIYLRFLEHDFTLPPSLPRYLFLLSTEKRERYPYHLLFTEDIYFFFRSDPLGPLALTAMPFLEWISASDRKLDDCDGRKGGV